MASILFAGAAGEVTGSRHLLEINGKRILLDCGMFQGHRKQAEKKNRDFLFDPSRVDAVILSHAHLDHCGNLPRLVKQGFQGKIWCTKATAELAMLILEDSARIQQSDAAFYNKRHPGDPIEPLYHDVDVMRCRERLSVVGYSLAFEPVPGMKAWLHEAGHILGSAQVSLQWEEAGKERRLLFSGDLGRRDAPLLKDPYQTMHRPDVLLLESTYGARLHGAFVNARKHLAEALRDAVERRGKVVIPAFAVGRAQEIIVQIAELRDAGLVPHIPVFVDSPMASRATRIFAKNSEILDSEFHDSARRYNPFDLPWIKHTEDVEESKAINGFEGSCVIISASGMAESGRVLHHLRNLLPGTENMVLIVGYQSEGTLGRRLVDGQKEVLVYGMPVPVAAEVRVLNEYSAHADQAELVQYVRDMRGAGRCFLVHGENSAAEALRDELAKTQNLRPEIPDLGQRIRLFEP